MSDIQLKFQWSDTSGQGRVSPTDSMRLLSDVCPVVAADFLQDVISDASDLYNMLMEKGLARRTAD